MELRFYDSLLQHLNVTRGLHKTTVTEEKLCKVQVVIFSNKNLKKILLNSISLADKPYRDLQMVYIKSILHFESSKF